MQLEKIELLESLIQVQGLVSDETRIRDFIIEYINSNQHTWKVQPTLYYGDEFHDTLILVFGQPRTAIYAHMDTIGFSVGYEQELIKVGGPRLIDGTALVGTSNGEPIEGEMMVIELEDGGLQLQFVSEKPAERGTLLSFQPNFRTTEEYVQSPYLDNRLGCFSALRVAETLENGAIVFSTYEEHGGNSVGHAARFLLEKFNVRQALISDITWVTHGVVHGGGVAISLRDSLIPRRAYLNRILEIAKASGVPYQLEVESAGGSDGGMLQKSDMLIDWCFIGAPEDNVHTPNEKVFKSDIVAMIDLYRYLMNHL